MSRHLLVDDENRTLLARAVLWPPFLARQRRASTAVRVPIAGSAQRDSHMSGSALIARTRILSESRLCGRRFELGADEPPQLGLPDYARSPALKRPSQHER